MQIRDRVKELRRVPASELKPNPKNWRTHPKEQQDALRGILADIGFADALIARELADGSLELIDGHLRAETTPDMQIPVLILDLNDEEAGKLLAVLDPLAAMAETDQASLDALIASIHTDNDALQEMLDSLATPDVIETEEVGVPDEVEAVTQLGDIWLLGRHRLMCGDSAKLDDVETLMAGTKADMIFTDPPYGVAIGDKNKQMNKFKKLKKGSIEKNIVNDCASEDELYKILLPCFVNIKNHLNDCAAVYVTAPQGGGLGLMMMMMMMKEAGLDVRHILIWVKNSPTFSMVRLDYDYQHEPILFTWNKTHKRRKLGKHQTSCWFIDKEQVCGVHPTMKPIALIENALLNSSDESDTIMDLFGGSGSTLIACEQLGRTCRMMEIDPHYCDVIIKRWEEFTGNKAVRQEA